MQIACKRTCLTHVPRLLVERDDPHAKNPHGKRKPRAPPCSVLGVQCPFGLPAREAFSRAGDPLRARGKHRRNGSVQREAALRFGGECVKVGVGCEALQPAAPLPQGRLRIVYQRSIGSRSFE